MESRLFTRITMRGSGPLVAGVAMTVTILTAPQLCAQSAPEAPEVRRPFRGIFGAPSSSDSPHSLVFSASAFAAYDDNVLEELTRERARTPWLQETGIYQGANAGLNYTFDRKGERVNVRGNSNAEMRYYRRRQNADVLPHLHSDVSFDARLTRSLSFEARQSLAYAFNYNLSLIPGADENAGHDIGTVPDPDLDLFGLRALRAATTLSLSQQFGKSTTLAAGYNFRSVNVLETEQPDSRFRDYRTHAGTLGLRHTRQLTRSAQLELGYGIRVSDGRSRTGDPRIMHNVIAGINYSRALSFSRRTSFSFGSGSAIAVSDSVDSTGTEPRARARLVGNVALVHEIGRTWTAQLGYQRGFRTREGFGDLYFTDGAHAGVGGLITRRLSFSAAAGGAVSTFERAGRGSNRGFSATAQATYALSSYLAIFTRYVYYRHRYDDDIPLDPRFPRQLDRQGVRVGLTTTIPLIR